MFNSTASQCFRNKVSVMFRTGLRCFETKFQCKISPCSTMQWQVHLYAQGATRTSGCQACAVLNCTLDDATHKLIPTEMHVYMCVLWSVERQAMYNIQMWTNHSFSSINKPVKHMVGGQLFHSLFVLCYYRNLEFFSYRWKTSWDDFAQRWHIHSTFLGSLGIRTWSSIRFHCSNSLCTGV
jgi:hypothetical protein